MPLSRLLSRPLVSIQLHCLPSSSYAAKAKFHPSGDGVQPHLPTSEFVCVDELWTYSAGMFFCGDYKGPYSDWEASAKLSHSNFFVLLKLSGGGFTQQTPQSPNNQLLLPLTTPNCKPANPSGPPGILTEPNKSSGSKHEGFTVIWNMYFSLLSCLIVVCLLFWNNIFENPHFPFLLGTALLGKWGGDTSRVVVFYAKS